MTLDGSRLLVVGGSSGVGKAIGLACAAHGARVAFAGRRRELLDDAVASAKGGAIPLACDVRDATACEMVASETAAAFGGIDAVVYTPADLPFQFIEEAGADDWRRTLETNVVAPALITRAALPHLRESQGRVVLISSDITHFPRSALGLYAVSKHALAGLCTQLRIEVPEVRFTLASLGPVGPSEISRDWDYSRMGDIHDVWVRQGINYRGVMHADDVAEMVVAVLTTPVRVDELMLQPPEGGPI
jgi:NAD(P)-dependent dehydrogenase (short-subunit alcohol dehydrogenase family)